MRAEDSGGGFDAGEIEAAADRALSAVPSWIWDGRSLPVPLERIVDSHFMLLVRDVEDMTSAPGFPHADGSALSGLLLTALGEIWVNAEEARQWPARRRFTVGHELGHWVLHRDGQQSMFCRHPTVGAEVAEQLRLDLRPRRDGEADRDGQAEAAEWAGLAAGPVDRPASEGRTGSAADRDIPPEEAEANAFSAAVLMPRDLFLAEHSRLRGDVERLCERFGSSEKATQRRIAHLSA